MTNEISLIKLINEEWKKLLSSEFSKPYISELELFLNREYNSKEIYPSTDYIFNAFNLVSPSDVKVVILGQDPYHNKNQANGLSFSVNKHISIPPSLRNIIKELKSDVNISEPMHGDLSSWAKQGVLLLNTVLTVEAHKADSHKNKNWETFTDEVIKSLNTSENPIVFLLWGKKAIQKKQFLTNEKHLVLESHHPSPLSAYRGFLGCKHFSTTNTFLIKNNLTPIDWEII